MVFRRGFIRKRGNIFSLVPLHVFGGIGEIVFVKAMDVVESMLLIEYVLYTMSYAIKYFARAIEDDTFE